MALICTFLVFHRHLFLNAVPCNKTLLCVMASWCVWCRVLHGCLVFALPVQWVFGWTTCPTLSRVPGAALARVNTAHGRCVPSCVRGERGLSFYSIVRQSKSKLL